MGNPQETKIKNNNLLFFIVGSSETIRDAVIIITWRYSPIIIERLWVIELYFTNTMWSCRYGKLPNKYFRLKKKYNSKRR